MAAETPQRPYGTGRLFERSDSAGRVTYYGKWRRNGQQVKRKLGPKRTEGSNDGLTRRAAEAKLRKLMAEVVPSPSAPVHALTIAEVGERYITHLEKMKGRKLSTRTAVESTLRVHLEPYFGERGFATVTREDVEDLRTLLEGKVGPKSVRNYMGTLSALYRFAMNPSRKWASVNPCDGIELPEVPENEEIRFLQLAEVEAVVRHAEAGTYQALDRALYRTAAMTGMREGELIAVRWSDINWTGDSIHVRQNFVLNEFGTPKSKQSFRTVPMAPEVAQALERYYQASGKPPEHLLVFGEPVPRQVMRGNRKGELLPVGSPLDKAHLLRRFRRALKAAQVAQPMLAFHELRHTFGTQMAAHGVPMRTLQEWFGHRDIKTTERYVHYAPKTRDAQIVAAAFSQDAVPAPVVPVVVPT